MTTSTYHLRGTKNSNGPSGWNFFGLARKQRIGISSSALAAYLNSETNPSPIHTVM